MKATIGEAVGWVAVLLVTTSGAIVLHPTSAPACILLGLIAGGILPGAGRRVGRRFDRDEVPDVFIWFE